MNYQLNGQTTEDQLQAVKDYRALDYSQDPVQLQKDYEEYRDFVMKRQAELGPYPKEIWNSPTHKQALTQIFGEMQTYFLYNRFRENDSENDYGQAIYKPEKDEELKGLLQKRDQLYNDLYDQRDEIIARNKEKKAKGLPLDKVPNVKDFEFTDDILMIDAKIQNRRNYYLMMKQEKRRVVFGFDNPNDGVYRGDVPSIINQLNIAINNFGLPFDKRCEMAILALRERKRFNQCRKLGLKVPMSYVRILSAKCLPKHILNEILKYPSAIEDDSEYEDDSTVLQKYKDDPVAYINQYSQEKREKQEGGEEPYRLYNARVKAGDLKFTDIISECYEDAIHQMLTDNGIHRGVTEEKIKGTYVRPAHINPQFLNEEGKKYFIENLRKWYYEKYGDAMFQQAGATENLLRMMQGERILLRQFPEIIKSMFAGRENEIPEDLRIEENPQKSAIIEDFQQHVSRRQSLAKSLQQSHAYSEGDDEVSAFMNQEEIEEIKNSIKKQKQAFSEQPDQQKSQRQLHHSSFDNTKKKYEFLDLTNPVKNALDKAQDYLSSESSGIRREQFDHKEERDKALRKFADDVAMKKQIVEQQFWHQYYDKMLKRCNDLGIETLKQYIKDGDFRKLSRREQTHILNWGKLGDSAKESDDSRKQAKYSHPVMVARQRYHNQKLAPNKRKLVERKENDNININGKEYKWGQFKKQFYEDINRRIQNNEIVSSQEMIMNIDKPNEKILSWHYKSGFYSENSQDEEVKFEAAKRQYQRNQIMRHGDKPYLRQRPILQFERMILRFGGADTLRETTGKEIESKKVETIYEWIDPNMPLFTDFGDFLLQQSLENFNKIYLRERRMQLLVMNSEQVNKSVFANEIIQLYLLMQKTVSDKELQFSKELQASIPKDKRDYIEDINFEHFVTPPSTPLKEKSPEQMFEKLELSEQQHDQEQEFSQDFDYDQDQLFQEPKSGIKEFQAVVSPKKEEILQPGKVIFQEGQVELIDRPKFILPKDQGEDYKKLQNRFFSFKETIEVDDYVEIKNIINEVNCLDPQQIENNLIPKLQQLVQESNGRLSGYFIWHHHRVDGQNLIYPNGRRYPKRLKQYNYKVDDKAINVGGIEIGYLISSLPRMNPDLWKGLGIPLFNEKSDVQTNLPQKISNDNQPARQQNIATVNQQKNPRKRKANEALNMGAGMGDYHKDDIMFKIEQQLPFMKYRNDDNQTVFNVLQIEKINDNKQVKININLNPGQKLQQKDPLSKPITFENVYKIKASLKISMIDAKSNDGRRKQFFIDEKLKIGAKTIWDISNTSNRPIEINMIIDQ